ncbi:MAG TPA: glycosyl hydrolase family 28 protein [Kofleriaceae bacterium]|nr:glycosyl hydrolase family 28 protein [Kofleriaceae bacterium]
MIACTAKKPPAAPVDATAGGDGSGAGDGGGTKYGAYVLFENFNAMTTGQAPAGVWTTAGSAIVQEVPFAADKSVAVSKPAGTGTASLSASIPPQHGRVVFEAKVRAGETAGFKAIPYIYDGNGAAVASVSFQDGNIQAHVGASTVTVEPFVAHVWYRVRVVVDTDAGAFDLYIDGVRMLQAQALRAPSSSVAKLSYYTDSTTAATLEVDNVKVYTEAGFIGAPPTPVFDPRDYGARGDGTTNDVAAIQQAIDAAANTGGSVVLRGGVFLSGELTLHGNMTFFIDASATLRGSTSLADYPTMVPATGNTQLSNCQRALLYATDVQNLTIDGGGTIDGQGDAWGAPPEGMRPMLIWAALDDHVTIQNVYLMKGAVWSLVSMESDDVLINNVNVQSNSITHDGIDIVDGNNVTVQDVAVRSGDDAMCLKAGVRRGITNMTVKNSFFGGYSTSGGSNGIKFGTATYGAFDNITIVDNYVKDVQYAAMAVESRQGSDIDGVTFQRIEFANTGAAFFVYLAQQNTTHPIGDVPKLGSVTDVAFTDILGSTASWKNSPHQGSLITGHLYSVDGKTYPLTNLSFTNVNVTFDGGSTVVPGEPLEAMPDQYPESNMFGDLPAWGYYLRHVQGVTFQNVTSNVAASDARQKLVTDDVSGQTGSP